MDVQPTIAVANYFIGKAHESGDEITPMKLVKLVYIAHGWLLGLTGQRLIGEQVQAWKFGPVVASVYHDFKHYGRSAIDRQKMWLAPNGETTIPTVKDPVITDFLDQIWAIYGKYNGLQLSDLTHRPNTPWQIAWDQGGHAVRGAPIPDELIRKHYEELAARNSSSAEH